MLTGESAGQRVGKEKPLHCKPGLQGSVYLTSPNGGDAVAIPQLAERKTEAQGTEVIFQVMLLILHSGLK